MRAKKVKRHLDAFSSDPSILNSSNHPFLDCSKAFQRGPKDLHYSFLIYFITESIASYNILVSCNVKMVK